MQLTPDTNVKFVQGHAADSWAAATTNKEDIDTKGFTHAMVIVNAGTAVGTTDITVESATASGGTYAAITGAAFTQITTANDNAIYAGLVDVRKTNRWLGIQAVTATAAVEFSTCVLLFNAFNSDEQSVSYSFNV